MINSKRAYLTATLVFLILSALSSVAGDDLPRQQTEDYETMYAVSKLHPKYVLVSGVAATDLLEVTLVTQLCTVSDDDKIPSINVQLEQRNLDKTVVAWTPLDLPWEVPCSTEALASDIRTWDVIQNPDVYSNASLRFVVSSDSEKPLAFSFTLMQLWDFARYQTIFAVSLLVLLYGFIVFEVTHRTIVALMGCAIALSVVWILRGRPPLEKVVTWVDTGAIALLLGMMIIVGVLSTTGFFEWCAIYAFILSKGHLWRLLVLLCLASVILSAFLDNVTTILLLAPVTLRLANVVQMNPIPLLLSEVIFSNVGGTMTMIGDPPNIIIGNYFNDYLTFLDFITNLTPVLVIDIFVTFGIIYLYYGKELSGKRKPPPGYSKKAEPKVQYIAGQEKTEEENIVFVKGNELEDGTGAYQALCGVEEEEDVSDGLEGHMMKSTSIDMASNSTDKLIQDNESVTSLGENIIDFDALSREFSIHNKKMFYKSISVLLATVIGFCLESLTHLEPAWVAMVGATVLLVMSTPEELDPFLHKVEWSTLLFFAALFIFVECLAELGLIRTTASLVGNWIGMVAPEYRLVSALIIVMWVSAIVSAFIDNVPWTATMVPIVASLAKDTTLDLKLRPLIWALSLGACLGGNGTIIGASANIVAAGVAETAGYPITFRQFFKVGMPVMLVTVTIASGYVWLMYAYFQLDF